MKLQSFKLLLSLFLLTAFTSVAADQWFMPNYNDNSDCCCDTPVCWQGFYLSGQIGGGWHKHHARFRNANFFNTIPGGPVLGSRFDIRSEAFVGGGGIGYNYQCNDIIVGVEGGALSAHHKKTRNSPFFSATDRYHSNLDWIGYAKARLGFTHKCFLVFITGGWAGSNPELRLRDPELAVSARSRKWINGWTLGGGVDYKVWDCFSVGVAYDYIQLQDRKRTLNCANCNVFSVLPNNPRVSSRHHLQTLVFRLNYHFNLFNL